MATINTRSNTDGVIEKLDGRKKKNTLFAGQKEKAPESHTLTKRTRAPRASERLVLLVNVFMVRACARSRLTRSSVKPEGWVGAPLDPIPYTPPENPSP